MNEKIKEFRANWQAVAAVENAEQRAASVDLRWRQLNTLVALASGLGLSMTAEEDETELVRRWAKLKGAGDEGVPS